jgi:hypothetical protein
MIVEPRSDLAAASGSDVAINNCLGDIKLGGDRQVWARCEFV